MLVDAGNPWSVLPYRRLYRQVNVRTDGKSVPCATMEEKVNDFGQGAVRTVGRGVRAEGVGP